MKLNANVIGATGLVGRYLVEELLANENFEKVKIFVRKNSGIQHLKLEQKIVDFSDPESWKSELRGDILFSALGTTLKQAGSREKQFEVDYTFNLNFAQQAKNNGIEKYVLVSSVGANANSRIFYTRIKGQLDEAVAKIGFDKLAILRPASLTGGRQNKRPIEEITVPMLNLITKFVLKKYRPIHGKTVAKAMINAALIPSGSKFIWEGPEVFDLSGEI